MSLAALLLSALVAQTDAGPATSDAPAAADTAELKRPDTGATNGTPSGGAAKPRRWRLETLEVTGSPQKPGVVFVDPEREKARAAMQALLGDTVGGQFGVEVSRPAELPERRPRVRHLKVRGALREGQVLRAVEAILPQLPSCRLADRKRPPTDIEIDVELRLGDDGNIVDGRVRSTRPTAPRTALCVLGRLKRAELPPSSAGTATIEIGLVLPAPYAMTRPAESEPPRAQPAPAPSEAKTAPRSTR